jgi:hypothetical protein
MNAMSRITNVHIVTCTCIPIAKQRVGKHIPTTHEHVTIEGHPLLDNGQINKGFLTTDDGVFCGVRAEEL